jgi:transposase
LERTAMSEGERRRAAVFAQVAAGEWTVVEAAERMELSDRQSKRLGRRYRKQGAAGLVHRNAGGAWNRATPKKRRAQVVRLIREKYGVPRALYTDWKNVYLREPTQKEVLHGTPARTQFGGMCGRLGIKIIAASSPQAKGRVERHHGTHQDRLVKKLRRLRIATHEPVNRYLEQEYGHEHNRRFAIEPVSEVDAPLPAPGAKQRREIFRLETPRTWGNDWVVRHHNRFYPVERQSRHHAPANRTVVVCEGEEGTMEIHYRGQQLRWHEIQERPGTPQRIEQQRPQPFPPSAAQMPNHPWRRSYQDMKPLGPPSHSSIRRTPFHGLSLRCALNARLRLAGLRSGRGHRNQLAKKKRKGTLLMNAPGGHF